ncbi:MAG: hypothetical protein KF796_08440 [Ramlibacter sp.]|nr:hypothetical protein [Ramlibacter sp.]
MPTRLSTVSPEIEEALADASSAERVAAARLVALKVAKLVLGVPDALFEAASDLAAIAENLDERYFRMHEQGAAGWEEVFAQARAVAALRYANEAEPEEALYEAVIALDDPRRVFELLNGTLNGSV